MRTHVWRIDDSTEFKLVAKVFGKHRFYVNDDLVHESFTLPKTVDFKLPDGRSGQFKFEAKFYSHKMKLLVEGKEYVSNANFIPSNCSSCENPYKANDNFCTNCGARVEGADVHLSKADVREATKSINIIGVLFILGGILFYFLQQGVYESAFRNLEQYSDTETIVHPVSKERVVVGNLKSEMKIEMYSPLIINFTLAGLMFLLGLWGRKAPLPALLVASALYAMVIVVSAIADPRSIAQGIIMKIMIISLLVRGVKSALKLRTIKSKMETQTLA